MQRTLGLLISALASITAIACQTPAPFDAAGDCPKLDSCGQCASRGGCAWCGDAAGKGQCAAVGHAECGAPASWSKTPDRCPAPPVGTGMLAKQESASPSPMEKLLGPEKYASIQKALAKAFPHANVNNAVVDGVAETLVRSQGAKGPANANGVEKAPISRRVTEKAHRLYMGHADHHRVKSAPPASRPMESEFTLDLPMVRVTLPERLGAENNVIATELGDVDLSRDHLLGSIDLIDAKYGGAGYLGRRPARVDLITPARLAHARFGAMAVYLGYANKGDRGPSFYMLEAGTATGDAKMIYFSPKMQPITSVTSHYLPTPFVTMANTYSGGVTMAAAPNEDEPAELLVESRAAGEKDPYITVRVKYERVRSMDVALPVELTADAASRIALIAKTMGLSSAIELQPVLAELAKTIHWQEVPRYVEPAASPKR